MIGRPPRDVLEDRLSWTNRRLALMVNSIELLFERAVLLRELGLTEESKQAYLELLARAPTHFGALNNLGTLAMETGYRTAAQTAYAQAVKHHPDNPIGHINLASLLARTDEPDAALQHFQIALQLAPGHPEAHQGISQLLSNIGREEEASTHRIKGFQNDAIKTLPFRGTGQPVNLLVMASATGGAVPIWRHLDDQIFSTSVIFADFYDPAKPLPPHELVFNAIGDADLCGSSLDAAETLLRQTAAPVINPPHRVIGTGRAANAARFAKLPHVITPKMALLQTEDLHHGNAKTLLDRHGISFPCLLRAPGFHNGDFFHRADNQAELESLARTLPGEEALVIQFLDARSRDGKIRKYRVMMIDGKLYPLHVAISPNWKIHFVTAEMADNPNNRAEDSAFLNDMPRVLGPKAMTALASIQASLGLDYAGADFSLNDDGDVLLFEANATMIANPPDADAKWDYRRPAVQRILDAIQSLLKRSNTETHFVRPAVDGRCIDSFETRKSFRSVGDF